MLCLKSSPLFTAVALFNSADVQRWPAFNAITQNAVTLNRPTANYWIDDIMYIYSFRPATRKRSII